ncbi:hypothetical protein E2C01_031157 [Portunus trituberculatus]|uniref:Uncharacterized protein n=1 Tax=Portunus trituberculatus TaxID=210409 RepID=A0A5B7ESA5_PORTR|nr:hypothetical protein [Portunus trituberculatus]
MVESVPPPPATAGSVTPENMSYDAATPPKPIILSTINVSAAPPSVLLAYHMTKQEPTVSYPPSSSDPPLTPDLHVTLQPTLPGLGVWRCR